MSYPRSVIANHFDVNIETIRRWSRDFAQFLSPSANDSSKSEYTDDDMEVLTYVHEAYKDNQKTENIIASLATGTRGEWNGVLHNHSITINESQLEQLQAIAQERDDLRLKLIEAEKTIAALKAQVGDRDSLQEKVDALNRQIGRLEARIDMMKEGKD